jgi:hypothetical protein
MKSFTVLSVAATALTILSAETPRNQGLDANAAFARLKDLAGEWQGSDPKMGKLHVTYEVVSGGSAVLERFTAEKMPPGSDMVTVYYKDGDGLLLTHYCMAQNQPRMRATRFDPSSGELEFDMLDATNLKPGGGTCTAPGSVSRMTNASAANGNSWRRARPSSPNPRNTGASGR